jgi:hypothetical protein
MQVYIFAVKIQVFKTTLLVEVDHCAERRLNDLRLDTRALVIDGSEVVFRSRTCWRRRACCPWLGPIPASAPSLAP